MTKTRQDPAFNDQHRHLDFGFIFGLGHPRWDHCHAVMRCHLGVGAVHIRLIAMRVRDAGFKIVRHHGLADTVKEGKRPLVRADPVRQ